MSLTGHHINGNPSHGVPEATSALYELLQSEDGGVKPDLERAAIWAQQSAEFKTEQSNVRVTSSRWATVSGAPIESRNELQKTTYTI
jgi:hypothetical protein